MIELWLAALLGGLWRWADGRGLPPRGWPVRWMSWGWLRLILSFALALAILWGKTNPWWLIGFPAGAMAAIWLLRQKQREELDDMALRWGLGLAAVGAVLAFATWTGLPFLAMLIAGSFVTVLVWAGVTYAYKAPHPWLDSSAVAEFLSGVVAFGGLWVAAHLI